VSENGQIEPLSGGEVQDPYLVAQVSTRCMSMVPTIRIVTHGWRRNRIEHPSSPRYAQLAEQLS